MKPDVSIVIPAYNESSRIIEPLNKVLAFIEREGRNAEVIVVDDGSTDTTTNSVEELFAARPAISSNVVTYRENRGKGYAIKTGLLAAKADTALFTDADLSTP